MGLFLAARAPEGRRPKPGEWVPTPIYDADQRVTRGRWSAVLWCPDCGKPMSIPHAIDADGTATPSVQCPRARCGWHPGRTRFVGWSDLPPVPDAAPPSTCTKCGRVDRGIGGWGLIHGGLLCDKCFASNLQAPKEGA